MKLYLIAFLMSLAMNRCADSGSEEPTAEMTIIRSGTSYGFCVGYCQRTLELTGTTAVFTMSSSRSPAQNPTKTCRMAISASEWARFTTQADLSQLSKQPQTLGCPDCADGGAEFLEIQQGSERYRVTFEAGKTVPGFEALITALREKRETFADCK